MPICHLVLLVHTCLGILFISTASAEWLLLPMDKTQTNHLKAYGLTYWTLEVPREYTARWLLNYRGGSFLLTDSPDVRMRALQMGISYEPISNLAYGGIRTEMDGDNMDEVLLEKAPKIAVYAPAGNTPYRDPWDDAVKLALDYAQYREPAGYTIERWHLFQP